MNSEWYLFPGQTEEDTKICERGTALVATPEAWSKITDHLDRNKIIEKVLEEEQARRKYLKDGSYEMTKNWDNSIEKISKRRLEDHENRIKTQKEDRMNRFMELRKEQEDERIRYIKNVKKKMFMFQEKPRNLNSALILSEVMYERNLQKEFDERQREHEGIEEAKYAQHVKFEAEKELFENTEKQKKRKETQLKYKHDLVAQIHEIQEEEKISRDLNMKSEIIENIRAEQELGAIKEHEFQLNLNKKKENRQTFLDFNEMQKRIREEEHEQDVMEDKIIQVYAKAKCRIDYMRKEKTKEIQDEKVRLRNKVAAQVIAARSGFQEIEDNLLKKAENELKLREDEKLEKQANYQKRLRDERIEYRKKYMEQQALIAAENKEVEKFKLLNRLKTKECMDEYEQRKKLKNVDKIMKYRQMLIEQMNDKDREIHYEKICKENELKYFKKKAEDEDKKFFEYSNELLELAKEGGRSTDPILKVIEKYKIENGLEIKKKNISMLESKVPINEKKKGKACRCK